MAALPLSFLVSFVSAGTLISHEKLLLQINTEREMGNMDYKLGQVREARKEDEVDNMTLKESVF